MSKKNAKPLMPPEYIEIKFIFIIFVILIRVPTEFKIDDRRLHDRATKVEYILSIKSNLIFEIKKS